MTRLASALAELIAARDRPCFHVVLGLGVWLLGLGVDVFLQLMHLIRDVTLEVVETF